MVLTAAGAALAVFFARGFAVLAFVVVFVVVFLVAGAFFVVVALAVFFGAAFFAAAVFGLVSFYDDVSGGSWKRRGISGPLVQLVWPRRRAWPPSLQASLVPMGL